jgi:hypothetical protein
VVSRPITWHQNDFFDGCMLACCLSTLLFKARLLRGVITQPFWHVRSPRGVLEGVFGSSATTGGLLPRCRYDLPLESQIFSIFGVKRAKEAKLFRFRQKKQNNEKKLPNWKKTFNDPSGGFSGPKKAFRLRYDASMFT